MRTLYLAATLALSAGAWAERVLGRLGQTTAATTIYAAPHTKARVYFKTKAYDYLVVGADDKRNWLRVLMSNGATGYVAQSKVAVLPYEVTAKGRAQAMPAPSTARRNSRAVADANSRAGVANRALDFRGTRYVWGGNDLIKGIDCSGFVKKLYGELGVNLPRTAAEQALVGQPIQRLEDLRAGDRLYFWERRRNKIGHTGIYMGNGHFVHSSRGNGGVDTDYLSEKWRKILVAARR